MFLSGVPVRTRARNRELRRGLTAPMNIAPGFTSAQAAGLAYVSDDAPGYTRRRAGKGFAFYRPDGTLERDAATIARLRKLAVPPAWRAVWICSDPNGHIQATARDAKGRKQYRYHPDWRSHRDELKFDRMPWFGRVLPDLRARIEADLGSGDEERRVLAAVAALLDHGSLRIGSSAEAEAFGATTLEKRHADVRGGRVLLHFRGKAGITQDVCITHPRVARIVRRLGALPGQRLFQARRPDGTIAPVTSDAVNDYLRDLAGAYLSAKEFRTWHGSTAALHALAQADEPTIKAALEAAAARLGNTPAVCRKSYVHPAVIDLAAARERPSAGSAEPGLSAPETAFLTLIG